MLISRVSPFSGKSRQREIAVTQEQIDLWQNGMLIQRAMPNLTPDEREFIMTGISPEEWDETFDDQGVENDTEEESRERNYGIDDDDDEDPE